MVVILRQQGREKITEKSSAFAVRMAMDAYQCLPLGANWYSSSFKILPWALPFICTVTEASKKAQFGRAQDLLSHSAERLAGHGCLVTLKDGRIAIWSSLVQAALCFMPKWICCRESRDVAIPSHPGGTEAKRTIYTTLKWAACFNKRPRLGLHLQFTPP